MRVTLTGGAYAARSLIAAAQRCVNLYSETVTDNHGEPVKKVHYPTPGLTQRTTGTGAARGFWMASTGVLFAAIGNQLGTLSTSWAFSPLGTIGNGTTPVSMADNGITLVVVDGSPAGWAVTLATLAFGTINDPAFYGATRVDYIDTFFVFNHPGTNAWYCSLSNAITFDPLYVATKTGAPDLLQNIIVAHREIWLIGVYTTEIWFNAGAADFPFAIIPGAFVEEGTCAPYSVAKAGADVFWLSQNRNGERYVVQGTNYQGKRISTYAIEEALRTYGVVSDAVGFTYQQGGHAFYILTFPTADVTWAYDLSEGEWHERVWLDSNGTEHRHRGMSAVNRSGNIIVGDWANGSVYTMDPDVYTDAGTEIKRVRTFPHMIEDGDRVFYRQFIADMEVGDVTDFSTPEVSLRWSDDRGRSFGSPAMLSAGATGNYLLSMQVQRLGMARDRIFELSWSAPIKTSLTGAFIEYTKAAS